jgi:hypothetical protein
MDDLTRGLDRLLSWPLDYVRWCFTLHVPAGAMSTACLVLVVSSVSYGAGVKKGWTWERRMREWAYGLEINADGQPAAAGGPAPGQQDRQIEGVLRWRSGRRQVSRRVMERLG